MYCFHKIQNKNYKFPITFSVLSLEDAKTKPQVGARSSVNLCNIFLFQVPRCMLIYPSYPYLHLNRPWSNIWITSSKSIGQFGHSVFLSIKPVVGLLWHSLSHQVSRMAAIWSLGQSFQSFGYQVSGWFFRTLSQSLASQLFFDSVMRSVKVISQPMIKLSLRFVVR